MTLPLQLRGRPVDLDMIVAYTRNSLPVASAQMDRIRACAAQHQMVVVLGFSENRHDSLYISQAVIDADGELLSTRSKIKASHMERTVFGDASAECLAGVVDTAVGRVGALNCWEHTQPLLKYHTYTQREQIHVAAWPPMQSHQGPDLWSTSLEGTSPSHIHSMHCISTSITLGIPLFVWSLCDWLADMCTHQAAQTCRGRTPSSRSPSCCTPWRCWARPGPSG